MLRPFVPDDLDELAAIHAEESFWWYPLRGGHDHGADRASSSTAMLARYESDGFGIEALIDRASGAMIGWAGLAVPHFLPEILPGGRGRVAPVRPLPRARPGDRGRGGRACASGSPPAVSTASSASTSRRTCASGRVMDRLGFTHCLTTSGPRGEEVAVTELTRGRWEGARYSAE